MRITYLIPVRSTMSFVKNLHPFPAIMTILFVRSRVSFVKYPLPSTVKSHLWYSSYTLPTLPSKLMPPVRSSLMPPVRSSLMPPVRSSLMPPVRSNVTFPSHVLTHVRFLSSAKPPVHSSDNPNTPAFKKKPMKKIRSFFEQLEKKPKRHGNGNPLDISYNFYANQFQNHTLKHLDFFIKNIVHFVRALRASLQIHRCFAKSALQDKIKDCHSYFKPHKRPPTTDIEILALAVLRMLVKHIYHCEPISGKFTIGWSFRTGVSQADQGYFHQEDPEESSTLGPAFSLENPSGEIKPSFSLFRDIVLLFLVQAEKYEDQLTAVECLRIKVYQNPNPEQKNPLTDDEVDHMLVTLFKSNDFLSEDGDLPQAASYAKRRLRENYITQEVPRKGVQLKSFIVADLETIMYPEPLVLEEKTALNTPPLDDYQIANEIQAGEARDANIGEPDEIFPDDVLGLQEKLKPSTENNIVMVHVPCAAGFAVINPGEEVKDVPEERFLTWYSESYQMPDFRERSEAMMKEFLICIADVAYQRKISTIYFHNLSGFDGFLIQRSYLDIVDLYSVNALSTINRNGRLYRLTVKSLTNKKNRHNFQDSVQILPGSLKKLGKAICPEIGEKGDIPRDWTVYDLQKEHVRNEMLAYMRQDIRILGGILCKTQTRFFEAYQTDITTVLTISSLAMKIFRLKYLNSKEFKIYIPSRNEDKFLRKAFYGGHSDVYKPYGEDLFYYDINSLYPYIMKSFDYPEGKPKWVGRLEPDTDLKEFFGFVTAYIFCPDTIHKPLLPYRDGPILKYPTGEWVGSYFTPELVKAIEVGYKVIPMYGYIYKRRPSPFKRFVDEIYKSRLEAKNRGDEAMSFVYKILLNSLFGRLGMNPTSDITIHCTEQECIKFIERFQQSDGGGIQLKYVGKIGRGPYYQVIHTINHAESELWTPPRNTAVQMSAAITSYARVYMYDELNDDSTFYTDTDSLVRSERLPEEKCSQTELGKFKLEYEVERGVFLAPKGYTLWPKVEREGEESEPIVKQKGLAYKVVTADWFLETYAKIRNPKLHPQEDGGKEEYKVVQNAFVKDRKRSRIYSNDYLVSLQPPISNKRLPVYEEEGEGRWIETSPVKVYDLGSEKPNVLLIKARAELDAEKLRMATTRQALERKEEKELSLVSKLLAEVEELKERLRAAGLPTDTLVDKDKGGESKD